MVVSDSTSNLEFMGLAPRGHNSPQDREFSARWAVQGVLSTTIQRLP